MKIKHLLLPLVAGMALHATTATAREMPAVKNAGPNTLSFIENRGQVTDQYLESRKDIDFKLNGGNGLSIFIGKGKIHYQWTKAITPTVISSAAQRSRELSRRRQISSGQYIPGEEISPLRSAMLHSGRDDDEEMEAVPVDNAVAEALDSAVAEVLEAYRMDVELIGANPYAQIITEGKQSFHERYFLSWVNKDNSNGGVIANAFSKITYKDIYPNIDWVFYFNAKGQLEHDFVVHPGGKVSDIQIKYSGTDALGINPDGSLTATTPMGTVTENAPYSYVVQSSQKREEISPLRSAPLHFGRDDGEKLSAHSTPAVISTGAMALRDEMTLRSGEISSYEQLQQQLVASKFHLNSNILTFEIAPYSGTLVIDPVIEWGTYFGGSGDDAGLDITTDKWGNIYMCGSTNSTNNIVTIGAHQDTFAGAANDAFLSKWDQDGNLLWSTYYGGENVDVANGVACDTSGNVYMGGNSNSVEGIATTGSYQEVKAGNPVQNRHDAFIVKFDSSGARTWATYFGGSNNDAQTSFALIADYTDHVYITANAQSTDIPITSGVHQLTKAGSSSSNDAFIAKFNTAGNLVWSTYYGGENHDYPYGIDCDTNGNLYITGYTQSTTGISTIGAHQVSNAGGQDGFLTKFDSTGRQIWGTYIGASGTEQCRAMAIKNNMIAIAGVTTSTTSLSSSNAFQAFFGGGADDGFIACFDLNGQSNWISYYGGEGSDNLSRGVWINNKNEIYICGESNSDTGVATLGSMQDNRSGGSDFCIIKFTASGARIWGSYLGGADIENEPRITGKGSVVYMTGKSNSATGISTPNSYQSNLSGGYDAAFIKINDCDKPVIPDTIKGNIEVCSGSTHSYSVNMDSTVIKYIWALPTGWKGSNDSNNIAITIGNNNGMIRVVAVNECGGISDTQSLEVTVLPLPEPEILNNNFILSTNRLYTSYQWILDGKDIENATNATHIAVKDGDYRVQVTNEDDCTGLSEAETVTGTVAIRYLDRTDAIQVYPNPAKDMVYVQSNISGVMHLYGIDGRLINQDIALSVGKNSLKIDDLAMGIYQLQIVTDKDVRIFKIVKTE